MASPPAPPVGPLDDQATRAARRRWLPTWLKVTGLTMAALLVIAVIILALIVLLLWLAWRAVAFIAPML